MIHLDFADGTSAWLTDEQLKEQHPELYAKLRQLAPHKFDPVFAGFHADNTWWDYNGAPFPAGHVTHWMAFPEPPEVGK